MRKLVTIQKVKNILPIENSDFIELVEIMGWKCVVKKGEFKIGDFGIYFEVDSFLPIMEKFEFLRKSSYAKNDIMGEGFRIKTAKLRGKISQGLFLPLKDFPEYKNLAEGTEITELLNVKKWQMPEVEGAAGIEIGDKPYGIPTTDEVRIQSSQELIDDLTGKPYYIATKMDGTSCTIYFNNGQVGVCGRNKEYKETTTSGYWKLAHLYKIPEKLTGLGKNIALQGEYCGEKIQKNRLKLQKPKFFIFNVYDIDTATYYNYRDFRDIIAHLGLETVPVEEEGESFNYSLDELLEKANGKYPSGLDKEGIVIRSQENAEDGKFLSFKVINNDFLLKEK